MQTIRLGSTGSDVRTWQTFLNSGGAALTGKPLDDDGAFGLMTDAATRRFQGAKRLVPDGVVGPATWAAAGFMGPVTPSKNQNAPVDQAAYDVAVRAAPAMPEAHRRYALSVARGEGFFGLGWAHPSVQTLKDSAAFGLSGFEGTGSNNWGAVQGKGDAGSFMHVDYHANGTPYVNPYRKYLSREGGFLDMARTLLKPNVTAALDRGDVHGAVFAQHDNHYFELAPEEYFKAVRQNYAQLAANLDWQALPGPAAVPPSVVPVPEKKSLATEPPSSPSQALASLGSSSGKPSDSEGEG